LLLAGFLAEVVRPVAPLEADYDSPESFETNNFSPRCYRFDHGFGYPLAVIAGRTLVHAPFLDGLDCLRPVGHAPKTILGANKAVQEPELF
jgi:hypothetical protein